MCTQISVQILLRLTSEKNMLVTFVFKRSARSNSLVIVSQLWFPDFNYAVVEPNINENCISEGDYYSVLEKYT